MTDHMAEAINDSTPRAGIIPMINPFTVAEAMMGVGLAFARLNPFLAPFLPRR